MNSARPTRLGPISSNLTVPYIEAVKALLVRDSTPDEWLSNPKISGNPKVFCTKWEEDYPINSPDDLILQSKRLHEQRATSMCVIENISAEYIEAIGPAWNIDPEFFAAHATNPDRDKLWWGEDWDWGASNETPLIDSQGKPMRLQRTVPFLEKAVGHLDGIFEYHNEIPNPDQSVYESLNSSPNAITRHCFKDTKWPIQSNTRISYCRPNTFMYLILVDAPPEFPPGILNKTSTTLPTLRFPQSNSRGGVELPRLLFAPNNRYSLFENLQVFCEHSWHKRPLFDWKINNGSSQIDGGANVIPSHTFIYLWASCLWEENLKRLEKEIKRISFKEIRSPKLSINNELHDRREDLARLKAGLINTGMYVPDAVNRWFQTYELQRAPYGLSRVPAPDNFKRLIEEVTKLEGFLMETFQLFMSSISVQDTRLSLEQSRLSIDQARRGSRLTLLAFIYVPLSFVTGIFGMNIQQINSSGLSIWVCFVAVAAVVLLTLLVFWLVKLYGDRKYVVEQRKFDSQV